jgi:cytochrome c peroxidase
VCEFGVLVATIVAFVGLDARAWAGGDVGGADVSPPTRSAGPRFEAPAAGSYELPPIDRVSEHALLDANGKKAVLPGIGPGEAALVSFVYLSCGEACPLATATLHRLDRMLAADPELAPRVRLVTVSFDPERDTPERMRELSAHLEPRGRWAFLTAGDADALRPVLADYGQDAVWIPGGEKAPDRLRHVLKIFLVDDQRRVRNIYSTGLMDVRLVVNDLRTVLAEPAAVSAR